MTQPPPSTVAAALLQVDDLRAVAESKQVIGHAQSILMERRGTDAQGALRMLQQAALRTGRKLPDVAAAIVNSA